MKVIEWPLAKFREYPNNPRINDHAVDQIAAMIKEFGFRVPMIVKSDGLIVDGHLRLKAARKLGLAKIPVILADDLTDQQVKALRLAVNQAAQLADWDDALLKLEIGELKLANFDIKVLAFPAMKLTDLPAAADPDATPEPPKKPVTRAGDVWVLGQHRVIAGDCTDPATWKALFGTQRANMVFSDPPYGVSYKGRSGNFEVIEGDDKRRDELYKMLTMSLREMVRVTADDGAFYIWHATSSREDFSQAMKAAGLIEQQYLIWVKPSIVLGHSDYRWQHEPVFYSSKAGHKPAFYGERSESTTWFVQQATPSEIAVSVGNGILLLNGKGGTLYVQAKAPKNKKLRQVRLLEKASALLNTGDQANSSVWEVSRDGRHQHPTQKPVELARRAIENSSKPGQIVADGYLGSGSTLIGAEMTGRRCFGCEIDAEWVDVTIERWQAFSKQEATLEEGGRTFAQERANRLKQAAGTRKAPAARRGPPAAASAAVPVSGG